MILGGRVPTRLVLCLYVVVSYEIWAIMCAIAVLECSFLVESLAVYLMVLILLARIEG